MAGFGSSKGAGAATAGTTKLVSHIRLLFLAIPALTLRRRTDRHRGSSAAADHVWPAIRAVACRADEDVDLALPAPRLALWKD